MFYLFAIIAGIIIAVMVQFNGSLTSFYGLYTATFITHLFGLLTSIVITLIKKEKLFRFKKLPFFLYLGGCVGFLTTIFNNLAFGKISISAILALSLFGQAITSLFLDRFGWFGMPKRKFRPFKIIGLLIVFIGISAMLYPFEFDASMIISIIISLLSGVTVNVSRAMNVTLSDKTSLSNSTTMNYLTGFIVSLICLLIFGIQNHEMIFTNGITFTSDVWIYAGGILGAFVIVLTNMTFNKIDSLYATLLLFVGQVFTGIFIDLVLEQTFSLYLTIGAVLTLLGLVFNLVLDRRKSQKEKDTIL